MDNPKPRCSKCGSTQIYIRQKTGAIVCHHCGNVEEVDSEEQEAIQI